MSNFIDSTIDIENVSASELCKQQSHQEDYHHLHHQEEKQLELQQHQKILLTVEEEKEDLATANATDDNVNITVNANVNKCPCPCPLRIKDNSDHEGNGDGVSSNTYCSTNDNANTIAAHPPGVNANQNFADCSLGHFEAENDSTGAAVGNITINNARMICSNSSSVAETIGTNSVEMQSLVLSAATSDPTHSITMARFSDSSVKAESISELEPATNTVITTTISCPSYPTLMTSTSCSALPNLSTNLKSMFKVHDPMLSGGRSYAIIIKSGALSASASPRLLRRSGDNNVAALPRRVSFPKSDSELVTGYLEPANPWGNVSTVKSVTEIAELYTISCQKHNTTPLQSVLEHLKAVDLQKQLRQPALSLASIKLTSSDCEALEEIFKRVQYKLIDISNCELDETAISALFEMFEYYEATNELNISSNANGMTHRGWVSCIYMIGHSKELQLLNADGNPISKMSAESLGNALGTSNLHTLKLEHCGLRGQPLTVLCFKLRHNRILKELWLSFNDLDGNDADTIAELLKANHYLELLDISNNKIENEGLRLIVIALIMQSKELERRNTFQRSAAIDDDDDSISPIETPPLNDLTVQEKSDDWDLTCRMQDERKNFVIEEQRLTHSLKSDPHTKNDSFANEKGNTSCVNASSVAPLITTEEVDIEEDSDDTVRSNTVKNSTQNGGQSMLDKLLSMNSESSSEDAASNISTDTLAACCSEDTSLISDEIFDTTTTASLTIASSTTKTSTMEVEELFVRKADVLNETNSDELKENIADHCTDTKIPANHSNESADLYEMNYRSSSQPSTANQCDNLNNNLLEIAGDNDNSNSSKSQNNSINNSVDHSIGFNVTADETEYLLTTTGDMKNNDYQTDLEHSPSEVIDVNKNSKLGEDFDDTHSTDSAFESASEGDISRHLPDEFTRLSTSLETIHLDDLAKEITVETATIACEKNETLIATNGSTLMISTETSTTSSFEKEESVPLLEIDRLRNDSVTIPQTTNLGYESLEKISTSLSPSMSLNEPMEKIPMVTIAEENLLPNYNTFNNSKENVSSHTPPPPSTSPGSVICGLRRTETSCAFLTQSSRNCSQSTDSLCSDNSLDGSIGSGDLNFSSSSQVNEKLTKNDTLTRQSKQIDTWPENSNRNPNGLKALFVWNNSLTKDAGQHISVLLTETASLDILNIGKNCLSNDFILTIKSSLMKNTTLTTLGLQSAHLSAKGIETLSSILSFGGNNTLQRIDIRDNRIDLESLTSISEMLKSNTTVTQIDIDKEPKRMCLGSDDHLDYMRVLENVRTMCSRNEKTQLQMQAEKSASNVLGKKRSSYYLGSRKISLTCHTRPVFENAKNNTLSSLTSNNNKLEVKRKSGARLRSPVPSPPTISPSSSPNRSSRFQVFRVAEVSSLSLSVSQSTTNLDATKPISSSSVTLSEAMDFQSTSCPALLSTSLPTSCSLPLMSTISSSTQSIKRFSVMPRSRFEVKKVYEDPRVPIANRTMPPISPSISVTSIQRQQVEHKSMGASLDTMKNSTVDNTEIKISTNIIKATTTTELYTPSAIPSATNTTTANSAPKQSTNVNLTVSARNSSSSVDGTLKASESILSVSTSSSTTHNLSPSPSESLCSSSSSSTSPASSTIDRSDTSTAVVSVAAASPPQTNYSVQCPLAVFSDNDITLTKNTVCDTFTNALAATCTSETDSSSVRENDGTPASAQQRVRKTSWISNPTAVDKLLTLFHNPTTLFQRSSSPESKNTSNPTANSLVKPTAINTMESTVAVAVRKQSSSSWTQLGTEVLNATVVNPNDLVNNSANVTTSEQSRSFLDAASKQLRDFSKQVFRQNLSFGNETSAICPSTGGAVSNPNSNSPALISDDSSSVGSTSTNENVNIACDADCLPTDLKQEIKENISPEHTINEEMLHKLQKLSSTPITTTMTTTLTTDSRDRELCEEAIVECTGDNGDSTFTI